MTDNAGDPGRREDSHFAMASIGAVLALAVVNFVYPEAEESRVGWLYLAPQLRPS